MILDARDQHLIERALAVTLEIMSRAHAAHVPWSDADGMADLYLRLVPAEAGRIAWAHSIRWLLAGGLDLRDRPFDPMPTSSALPPPPEPAPDGGERLAA